MNMALDYFKVVIKDKKKQREQKEQSDLEYDLEYDSEKGFEVGAKADTEEYDGTSWATGGDLNTARNSLAGCGTQTAGLAFGGYIIGSNKADTEEYDGTAWAGNGDRKK